MPALPPVQHQAPTLTPGRLLFESIVPEQFRHDIPSGTPIGSKEVERVLQRIAETNPDLYSKVSSDLLKLGAKGSVETQTSFGLQDLKSPIDKQKQIAEAEAVEKQIYARKDLTEKQKNDELVKLYYRLSNETPDQIYNAALSQGSSLAKMVAAGARGNKQQLSSNIGSDWLIIDSEGKPVPVPLKHSYSEGLDPAEYFGSSYGTRQGMISTKFAVADSGFLSKQLSAASQDLTITSDDCGTHKGIQVAANDPDNIGAVLSKSVGPFRQGTIIDKDVERKLSSMGTKKIVVRSPLTCQADHGLCSACAGVRERGTLPSLNDNIGLAASSAIGEPLSQGLLSSKHSAGVANAGKAARTGGFKAINALFQSPKVFPDAATLSELSGRVSKVEDAPQGGKFVWVDDHKHYVHPDQELTVKPGQAIEAGDSLSDGVASPTDFIRLKGLGEGRKYMLNQLQKTMKDNGLPANRRNLEVVVRAVVNHVKIDDPEGFNGYLPDDIARYSDIEKTYVPPASAHKIQPSNAKGMYLHAPVLDYTIGTKITPRIAKDIEDAGETHIVASHEEPPFKAGMVRLMENPGHGLDWMSQLGSSYVKGNLLDNIHRGGATAPIHSTAPLPALAEGLEFGRSPKGQSGY